MEHHQTYCYQVHYASPFADTSLSRCVLVGDTSFDALPTEEAAAVCAFAAKQEANCWIVVDHYGADEAYLTAIAASPRLQSCVLDDHQVRRADLRLAPMQAEAPQSLCGVEYLLLKPEFETAGKAALPRDDPGRSGVVISFGGADTFGGTGQVIQALTTALAQRAGEQDAPPSLTVLASDTMAAAQGLDELLAAWPAGAVAERRCWLEAGDVAALFGRCKHAIVSCSGTAVEALAMGAAIVAWHSVDNQANHAKAMRDRGVPVVTAPVECAEIWIGQGLRACEGVDAKGAWRVAAALVAGGKAGSRMECL